MPTQTFAQTRRCSRLGVLASTIPLLTSLLAATTALGCLAARATTVRAAVLEPTVRLGSDSIVVASAAGAALNSDLLQGGGSDDTAILQRLLNRAANGKAVHLVVDGPALVRGLYVYSNTTVECTAGGGFYLMDGSPGAIIRNANRTRGSVLDQNIQIRGCFLNGNRDGQKTEGPLDSPWRRAQTPDGTFKSGLQFLGINHLTVENVTLWNIRSWAAWIANAKLISVRNVIVDSAIPPFPDQSNLAKHKEWRAIHTRNNDDGLHFNGPIQYLTVSDVKLRTWDDSIALNANEGSDDITLKNELGPFVGQGPITDVTISNVILMDSHHGFRLLSSNQRVDRILIQNVTGTIRERMAVISHFTSPSRGNFGNITFSNISVDCNPHPPWSELYPELFTSNSKEQPREQRSYDRGEEGDIPLFSINATIESLDIRSAHTSVVDDRPLLRIGRDAFVRRLQVDLSIHDSELLAVPMLLKGQVKQLKFTLDWDGTSPINYQGGSIEHVHFAGNRREMND